MIRAGDTIENPVTGERIVFRKTSRETGGEAVVIETLRPAGRLRRGGARPPEPGGALRGAQRHRSASSIGREELVAGPGERVTVPAGTPHKFWNAGDDEAHFVCEVRPALQFESLLETMFALAADGKTNRKGMPNPLRLAVIANAHFDTVRLPFPPAMDPEARPRARRTARPAARLPAHVRRRPRRGRPGDRVGRDVRRQPLHRRAVHGTARAGTARLGAAPEPRRRSA